MSDSSILEQVVDATTKAAGTASGFAPDPRPLGYGFKLGYSTGTSGPRVKVMRDQYETLPKLEEVVTATMEQEQALQRTPIQTTLGDLSLDPGNLKLRRWGAKDGIRILRSAFCGLVGRVPGTVRPDHAASYIASLNDGEWMSEQFRKVAQLAPSTPVTVHVWKLEDEWQIYAVSSNKYTPYPPALLVRDLAKVKTLQGARCQALYSPLTVRVEIIKDADVKAEDLGTGEAFRHVTGYRAAENLSSSVVAYEKILRSMCTNLAMCQADNRGLLRRRHIGSVDEISDHVVRIATGQGDRMGSYLDNYREGQKLAIPDDFLADVVKNLTGETAGNKRRAWLEVAGVKPAGVTTAILTAHAREQQNNLTGLHNAVTRAAHETPWPTLEGGEGLEQQATQILYNPAPVRVALEQAQQQYNES